MPAKLWQHVPPPAARHESTHVWGLVMSAADSMITALLPLEKAF